MTRKRYLAGATLWAAVAVSLLVARSHPGASPSFVYGYENVLGTSMDLKLNAESQEAADRAESRVMAEISRLNGILSGYDATSEFSRWASSRDQAVRISPQLMEVLTLWDSWRSRTNGALNPAAETIGRVWKDAQKAGRLPFEADLRSAVSSASETPWELNPESGEAKRLGDAPLLLNSFTKSYIVERAADAAMREPGVTGVVVNIGGDLVVRGEVRETINVMDPRAGSDNTEPAAQLQVESSAVATSGNYRRGFDIEGKHYSHIVDPRTGRTADEIASATVVAPEAVTAGALATAFSVLPPHESVKLASLMKGVQYLLIRDDGSRVVSAGWNALRPPRMPQMAFAPPQSKAAADAGAWNPTYEMAINVEIPRAQGFGARRPYVAVWIEDRDRFPVRTLALWFNNPRWLPDLRAWYRGDRLRSMSEGTEIINSVTSATRSPGKYSFKWDGRDNAGKLVKAGQYTVMIEAAREHGGYSLLKREINCNATPSQAQLPPDAEVGAVIIDYRKVAR